MGLVLAKKISGCVPDSFSSFYILGKRGIGKSSYALKVLHEVFMSPPLNYLDEPAWSEALNCLQFTIGDVVTYLSKLSNRNEKAVCLLWDDLRVFASGSKYFTDMKLVQRLIGMFDSIRTVTNCVLLTCPSMEGTLSFLRSYDDYMIKIGYGAEGGWNRVASGYLWSTLPSGKKLVYKKFVDNYSCHLPNWVYGKYMVRRRKVLKDALVDLNVEE